MDRLRLEIAPQLDALVGLAACAESMTDAATALGVSQSSISRRLHTLEQLLGIPLLIRDGRNVRLTTQARSLVDDVRARCWSCTGLLIVRSTTATRRPGPCGSVFR